MNSRSRKGQGNNKEHPAPGNLRYFITGILFLSVIWALLGRVMTRLGIIPNNNLFGTGSSTRVMTTRLSSQKPVTSEILRSAPQEVTHSDNQSKHFPKEPEKLEDAYEEQHNQSPTMRRI